MVYQLAAPIIIPLAAYFGVTIPYLNKLANSKGVDLSTHDYDPNNLTSYEDLFPELAELNRIKEYKTWDESYADKMIIDTPQGKELRPDPVKEETLEEWKARNIESLPLDQTPPFVLPGFMPEETQVETETFPAQTQAEKIILSTPHLKEEEKTPPIMTMKGDNWPLRKFKNVPKFIEEHFKDGVPERGIFDQLPGFTHDDVRKWKKDLARDKTADKWLSKEAQKNLDAYYQRNLEEHQDWEAKRQATTENIIDLYSTYQTKKDNYVDQMIADNQAFTKAYEEATGKKAFVQAGRKQEGQATKDYYAKLMELGEAGYDVPMQSAINKEITEFKKKLEPIPILSGADPALSLVDGQKARSLPEFDVKAVLRDSASDFEKAQIANIKARWKGKRVPFDLDHIKALAFDGKNKTDNLQPIIRYSHGAHPDVNIEKIFLGKNWKNGLSKEEIKDLELTKEIIPGNKLSKEEIKKTKEALKEKYGDAYRTKSSMDKNVHRYWVDMVQAIKNNDMTKAQEWADKANKIIDNAIAQKVSFRFEFGEPHRPYKVAEGKVEYLNEIDLYLNSEQAKEARKLIRYDKYTPDHLKSIPEGKNRLGLELTKMNEMLGELEAMGATTYKKPSRKTSYGKAEAPITDIQRAESMYRGGEVRYMSNGGNPHLESERLMAYDPGEYTLPVDPSDKDIDIDIGPYHDLSPWMDIDDLEFLFDVSNLSPEKIMEVLVQNGVPVEKAKAAVKRKVMKARDGGIVQYFQNAGEVKGISKFDVKPYIPPSLRIDEDPLTLGAIGETASEVAETAWPYMIPGVGEHLSKKDYEMFSAQAAQAWEEKNYPKYAGMLALGTVAAGGIIPNWTVVGAVPNVALGIYKGVRKALTPKMIAPPIKMEKRFTVQDDAGNKFYQTKSVDDAEVAKLRVQDAEGKNMNVVETEVPIKPKKTKQEIVPAFTLTADDVIGSGNNRLFYSKMDHYLQGTNGNLRVKTGASGNVADIPINEVRLSAKEWHDSFRAAGIKESELTDAYIRAYLNKKGGFTNGKFTNNQPIAYAEIKELMDQSPSKFVQASKYSDADGTLKFADSGRAEGYKNGTREEHVLWMDSKDIRGDIQELPSGVRGYEGHKDMRKVTDDVNFSANNKLEGEPYVIGWSLVDDRPGKLANGKSVTVTTANEIQSDFLQKAASKKATLKKQLRAAMQSGDKEAIQRTTIQLENIFRQMPKTSAEVKSYVNEIQKANKIFDDVARMDLNVVDDAVMKQMDDAAKVRDDALNNLVTFIDDIDPKDLFPNIPFKDQKDWVSSLIKNDIAIAAKKRFYFDENGVLQINKNAPSHYTVSPSKVVKNRWSVPDQYGMHVPANMRTTQQHGKGVAYDLEYGGPNVTDASGRHFTGNAEETLKKIASSKNAEFSIGKVKFKNKMEDSFLIELTPEMLTPYVQYFKHGGLVEAIPYNPLRSVLDVLGPIGAY